MERVRTSDPHSWAQRCDVKNAKQPAFRGKWGSRSPGALYPAHSLVENAVVAHAKVSRSAVNKELAARAPVFLDDSLATRENRQEGEGERQNEERHSSWEECLTGRRHPSRKHPERAAGNYLRRRGLGLMGTDGMQCAVHVGGESAAV